MKHLPFALTGLLALGLAAPAGFAAASEVPYGHKDPVPEQARLARRSLGEVEYGAEGFVPTPQRPINFRAGGNGWYPGATPPTDWSEGTPAQVDMRIRKGAMGDPSEEKVAKVWSIADTGSKNILWKAPVPGWGYAHPIVVGDPSSPEGSAAAGPSSPKGSAAADPSSPKGSAAAGPSSPEGSAVAGPSSPKSSAAAGPSSPKSSAAAGRVISLGYPHFVTCYDLKTGRQLWQREALPLLCEGQPEDKARAVQVAIDLASALCLHGFPDGRPFTMVYFKFGAEDVNVFQERAAKISRMLAKHRPAVEKIGDADLLAALDADLALTTSWEKTTDAVQTLADLQKKRPGSKLVEVVEKKYQVPTTVTWPGYLGLCDSAPVSDGERVYAVFGQGQVVCYDLDGNLVWARRVRAKQHVGPFVSMPLLVGDRLVVKDVTDKSVACYDARTGETLWTYPWKWSNHWALRHLRLTAPDGAPVDVIILPEHHKIVRLSDGKELGEFRAEKNAPPYHILGWDDTDTIAVGGRGTSGPTEPSACYRIKMTGPDSATGELVYVCETNILIHMNFPTATATHFFSMNGGIYDRKTGAKIGGMPGPGQNSVIAGNYLITQVEWTRSWENPFSRNREDNLATSSWRVLDISDPSRPRQVNQGLNLLGYKDPAADYIVKTYLSEFDPFLFAGCYRGTPSYFGTDLAGVVPHGNKLLIQSTAFLYCIGPAIEGTPNDNPATAQAIRAAKPAELATHLGSPSALYRHTAVTAMITAGIGGAKEALTKLVKEDPYEEIRAAAVLALNAAEPDAAPGTQALLPLMTAAHDDGLRNGRFDRQAMRRTLEALGKERGLPLLVAAFTRTQDEPTRRSLVDFAALMGWAAPEFTRQAQAYLAYRGPNLLAIRYLDGLGLIASDKEVREAVKRAYPHFDRVEEPGPMLMASLLPALEGEEKVAFLLHYIRCRARANNSDWVSFRAPFLRELQAMGRAGASAIPELEKLAAAHAHLAAEFAPLIEAIKGK